MYFIVLPPEFIVLLINAHYCFTACVYWLINKCTLCCYSM